MSDRGEGALDASGGDQEDVPEGEIGPWTDPALDNPLVPVFRAMFDGDDSGRKIDCAILSGYELGGTPPAALVTYLPVKFRPKFDYTQATPR